MKTLFIIFICSMSLMVKAQTSEEEKIKQLLHNSVADYTNNPITKTHLKDKNTRSIYLTRNYFDKTVSYDSLVAASATWSTESTAKQISEDNYLIKQNENLAYVEFDQTFLDEKNSAKKVVYHKYKILIKENNEWKIFSSITYNPDSYTSTDSSQLEDNMTFVGYDYLRAKKINEAIEIFKLNVKLFPSAWNTYDSLADAYVEAGMKKLAIKNYQKAMKLNPKHDRNAKIESLKGM